MNQAAHQMRPSDLAQAVMLTSSGTTKRLDRIEGADPAARPTKPPTRGS